MTLITGIIGSVITLVFGIWALVQPIKFSRFVSLTPYKESGISEIRATYGGWISALAIYALLIQSEVVFHCLGYAWFGAASIRCISMFVDNSYSSKSINFVIGEVLVFILFMV